MRGAIVRRGNLRPDIKEAQAVINGGTISCPHLRVMHYRVQIPCNGLWPPLTDPNRPRVSPARPMPKSGSADEDLDESKRLE